MKPGTSKQKFQPKEKSYQCQIEIEFPTSQHALHAKEVLQVDGEIGDQATKSFEVIGKGVENSNDMIVDGETKENNVLSM
jgi:hypothetical protein